MNERQEGAEGRNGVNVVSVVVWEGLGEWEEVAGVGHKGPRWLQPQPQPCVLFTRSIPLPHFVRSFHSNS